MYSIDNERGFGFFFTHTKRFKIEMEEERPKGRRAIVWCDPKSFKVDSLFVDGFSEKRNVTEGTLDLKRGDIVYVMRSSERARFWSGTIGDKSGTFFRKCVRWLPEEKVPVKEVKVPETEDEDPSVTQIPRKSSIVVDDIHDHVVDRSGGGDMETSWLQVFDENENEIVEDEKNEEIAVKNEIENEVEDIVDRSGGGDTETSWLQVFDENEMENKKNVISSPMKTAESSNVQILKETISKTPQDPIISRREGDQIKDDDVDVVEKYFELKKHAKIETLSRPSVPTSIVESKNDDEFRAVLRELQAEAETFSEPPVPTSIVERTTSTTVERTDDQFEAALRELAERECVKRGEALERQRRRFVRTIAMEKKITDELHEQALRDAAEEATKRYETELNRLRAENLKLSEEQVQNEEDNELEKHVLHQQAVHEIFDRKLADLHNEHDIEMENARKLRDEQIERARVHYESSVESAKLEESNSIQQHERAIANELDELNEDIAKRERT